MSLNINQITCDRFSSSHLNNTDVVILSNPHELTHDQSLALKIYLQNGGGMIFFPGTQTTNNAFNTTIAVPLGISTAATSADDVKLQSANSFIEFDKVDLHHPLFTGMFEEAKVKPSSGTSDRQRVLESPHISKSSFFSTTSKSQSIITLTNGHPFLIEEQVGRGRVLLFSVAANTEWSDLPLKGLFVLLVHRSLAYLVQKSAMEHSLLIDEEAVIHLRTTIPLKLTITKPGGTQIFINPQQVAAERSVRFSDNDLPGFYTIASDNLILDKFVVNVDPDESNTMPSDEKHIFNMFNRIGIVDHSIHKVNQMQEVQRIITESRFGTELWKQFLIAALLIAIIEMFVARDNKHYHSSAVKQI